ncbi:PAS domain S-box protein [Mangrovibacterium sp.]|uniref:PAS domain S-box protein n=1 Tax=Mangrovibacterium sp. TaxID=1961364 RepID=UPI0035667995
MTHPLLFFLLFAFAFCPVHGHMKTPSVLYDTITIGCEPDYPPYCILNSRGEPDGFAVDLFLRSAEHVGLNVKVEIGPWTSIRQRLSDGKIDALPIVADTRERKGLYDFTVPYLSLQGSVFTKTDRHKISQLSDLQNLKIYVMKGDNAEEYVRRNKLSRYIVATTTFDEAFRHLINDEADVVITQRIVGMEIIKRLNLRNVSPNDCYLPDFSTDFCFAVKKGDDELLALLNEGLSIVMANGEYTEIHKKWFGPLIEEKLSLAQILKFVLIILIPIVVLFSFIGLVLLRKQVKKRTRHLNEEIQLHERTLRELSEQTLLLKKSESQIRLLLNSTAEGIFGIDLEGNCTMINRAALNVLRYPDEDRLIGKNMHELIHHSRSDGSHRPKWECGMSLSFRSGQTTHEANDVFWRSDGTSFDVEYFSYPIREDEILKGAVVSFRDVSKRKKQERKLMESEAKFRAIFNSHTAAKVMIDPESLVIVEANSTAANLFKMHFDKTLRVRLYDLLPMPTTEIDAKIKELLARNNLNFELTLKKRDGSFLDLESYNHVISIANKNYILSVVLDVTGKRIIERQLRLLNRAVEHNPVMMMITDREGKIEYVNPSFSKITGYSNDDIVGKTPQILKSGFQSHSFYKNLWTTILSGQEWTAEMRNKKKDGSYYWENCIISPIYNNKFEITHFVAVKEDITQKKDLIRDLVVAKEKAEESDRLKTAFLANMSHEIRTPMNSILGFLELLQEPDFKKDIHADFLSVVQQSSDRLLNTINDIIETSELEARQVKVVLQDIVLNDLMSYLEKIFLPDAEKKKIAFRVVNRFLADFIFRSDKERLESILINLLKNAFKFTKSGYVEIGWYGEHGRIVCYIRDTGLGIHKDKLDVIFDRFTQAEVNETRSYEGAGLGLSIAKLNAELLNGSVWAESEPGKGSTFYLQIPIVTDRSSVMAL